jgi:pimeloyl-ACP methyl ester carboxylesterase
MRGPFLGLSIFEPGGLLGRWSGSRLILFLVITLLAACYRPRPAIGPLRILHYTLPGGPHRQLVVFLPGRGDLPEDFARRGLLDSARRAGLDVDVMAVDSHLGYFLNGSILTRLHDDVIAPARAGGYERIWLAGISLGAMGSILYMKEHPGEVEGAVLLSPYLGEPPLLREIASAGGLRRWPTGAAPDDRPYQLWRWLQATYAAPSIAAPPLWLAYGRNDRYAEGDRLRAAVLPPDRVLTAPGGHRWSTWKTLWTELLAAGAFPRRPS